MLLMVFSCIRDNDAVSAEFPESPTNLTEFNSQFDDYNSTAPSFGETFPFCFSSNRNSQGSNFDIIYKLMSIEFDKANKTLEIFNNRNNNLSVVSQNSNIANALSRINTFSNEYGPYLIPRGLKIVEPQTSNRYETYIILYSSEADGNQDIKFTHNLDEEIYTEAQNVNFLNTEFDDAYPSVRTDSSELYFASNRNGNYDIYSHDLDQSAALIENLTNTISDPNIDGICFQ